MTKFLLFVAAAIILTTGCKPSEPPQLPKIFIPTWTCDCDCKCGESTADPRLNTLPRVFCGKYENEYELAIEYTFAVQESMQCRDPTCNCDCAVVEYACASKNTFQWR